jgi:hypothetical protein
MFHVTGSAAGDKGVRRQPYFFEPMVAGIGATIGVVLAPGWTATSLLRPLVLAAVLLGWGAVRLSPLVRFVPADARGFLARRPLLAMLTGGLVALVLVIWFATVRWGGVPRGSGATILLVAIFGGFPFAASLWEDRVGRRARSARRSETRAS